jgi:hypothetical protein
MYNCHNFLNRGVFIRKDSIKIRQNIFIMMKKSKKREEGREKNQEAKILLIKCSTETYYLNPTLKRL